MFRRYCSKRQNLYRNCKSGPLRAEFAEPSGEKQLICSPVTILSKDCRRKLQAHVLPADKYQARHNAKPRRQVYSVFYRYSSGYSKVAAQLRLYLVVKIHKEYDNSSDSYRDYCDALSLYSG